MKRLVSILLALLLASVLGATLAGCDNYGTKPVPQDNPSTYDPYDDDEDPFEDEEDFDEPDVPDTSLDYEPYKAHADDPFPGLIIGTIPSSDPKQPPQLVVDTKKYEEYIYQNMRNYLDDDSGLYNKIYSGPDNLELRSEGKLVVQESLSSGRDRQRMPFEDWDSPIIVLYGDWITPDMFFKEYGVVITYLPDLSLNWEVNSVRQYENCRGERIIYYSLSLGRQLTQLERAENWQLLNPEKAFELWEDDWKKYMY